MPRSPRNKGAERQSQRPRSRSANEVKLVTESLLRNWPLPRPDEDGDKEDRGRVLVVGGAAEMPGAVILAATAALRAGAGKLQIATVGRIATSIGTALPEARVFALAEARSGSIAPAAADTVLERANLVHALVIGPGMVGETSAARFLERVLAGLVHPVVVIDAIALAKLAPMARRTRALGGRVILTPHAGEMARLLGVPKDEVARDPHEAALRAAALFGAVVALKGAETFIAAPDGRAFRNCRGNVGLATSGSGDTLSGIVAGLAARGAEPLQAAVWGVFLHGCAGDCLARRVGRLGFLARELLAEVPPLMAKFDK